MGAVLTNRNGWLSVRIAWKGRRWSEKTRVHEGDPEARKVRRAVERLNREIRDDVFSEARYLEYFPAGNRAAEFRGDVIRTTHAPTLGEYGKAWLDRQRGVVRISQYRNYKSHLRTLGGAAIGETTLGAMRLDRIKTADLDAIRAEWQRGGKSPKYVRNIIGGTLQALFRAAVADSVAPSNPCKGLRWARVSRSDADPFTEAERDTILATFHGKHPHYAPFVELLFYTGLRPSEAAGLRWGDIDLKAARLLVRRSQVEGRVEDTKTAQSRRTVALLPRVVALLRRIHPVHADADTPVFTGPKGAPFCQRRFAERQWRQVLRSKEIRPRRLYDTRHTFISLAVSAGANLFWLSKQVGTSVAMIEQRYGRFMPEAASTELAKLSGAMGEGEGREQDGTSRKRRPANLG